MIPPQLQHRIVNELYATDTTHAYAVLDGASIRDLLPMLDEHRPESACLYWGELEEDLEYAAPYLVRLERDTPFMTWLLNEGWGKHWGIFALSSADLKTVRRHFRTFLMVRDPNGKKLYFRYYDPRVLRVYLPTCNIEEMSMVFGPVQAFVLEGNQLDQVIRFRPGQDGPRKEIVATP